MGNFEHNNSNTCTPLCAWQQVWGEGIRSNRTALGATILMGQLDNTASNPHNEGKAAQEALRLITQDLRTLHTELSGQLTQDITRLQGTKHRLLNDLEILEEEYQKLQAEYDALKSQQEVELSRQQVAQQQLWAKRLAQALAGHLQSRLMETIYSGASVNGIGSTEGSLHNAYQLLAALDASLNETLRCIENELESYRKTLSSKIDDMRVKEKQGEDLLDALVSRISEQLQRQHTLSHGAAPPLANGNGHGVAHLQGYAPQTLAHSRVAIAPRTAAPYPSPGYAAPSPHEGHPAVSANGRTNGVVPPYHFPVSVPGAPAPATSAPLPKPRGLSPEAAFKRGILFIILSTLALSFHNVMVGIIGYGGQILGRFPVDGIFPLTLPNSLMLLWLRMLVVLPLMALVAGKIYPRVWRDVRQFLANPDKRPLFQVIASGGFLFLSQILIYKAISEIGPGVAVTLLFMYPLITVPLAWWLFGDRPTPLRVIVMFAITIGIIFTALPRIDLSGTSVSPWGVFSALLSSCAFALYLIAMQLSFRNKLHPVPVSLVQFTTIFVFSSVILIGGSFFGLKTGAPSSYGGLYLGGLLLGGLTLLGYLFNNFGVRFIGAAQAAIVASSGPVLTAVLAYLVTPGEKSMLQFVQWIGVVLVTLGVLALSLEKLGKSPKLQPKELSSR